MRAEGAIEDDELDVNEDDGRDGIVSNVPSGHSVTVFCQALRDAYLMITTAADSALSRR